MSDERRMGVALTRPLILVATAVLVFGALAIGQTSTTVVIQPGDSAPDTFFASRDIAVEDQEQTEANAEAAAANVQDVPRIDPTVADVVESDIRALFAAARAGTTPDDPVDLVDLTTTTSTTAPDLEPTTTTTEAATEPDPADESTTTTTAPIPRTADLTGLLYVDVDEDQEYSEDRDAPLPDVTIVAVDAVGEVVSATTTGAGVYTIRDLAPGEVTLAVEVDSVPERLITNVALLEFTAEAVTDDVVEVEAIPFMAQIRRPDEQRQALENAYPGISPTTLTLLVDFASGDVVREIAGDAEWLAFVEAESVRRSLDRLEVSGGILATELESAKSDLRTSSIFVFIPGADDIETLSGATLATAEVSAEFLRFNKEVDAALTEQARQQAYDATEPVIVPFTAGTAIVRQGDIVTPVAWEALRTDGVFQPAALEFFALGGVVTLLVTVLSVYISRFRPAVWGQMRRLALFGLMVVLAAVAARGIDLFASPDTPEVGYLLPAAAFGLMAAILFDARIAVLIAIAMGAVTAIATGDAGYVLFSIVATVAPVPWVSTISARGELRTAVVFTTVALSAMAASIAWFFHGAEVALVAAGFGALNGILSGLVGTAALSFLEIMFDVTTNLRLLDLTDRNHPALRLLEERAIGTFNHSLMVGTLADRAARSIGANNLLARAAAYYHDLGKTENPQFFIENQFGALNPHDRLPPGESAAIIRQHVIDGQKLVRRFRIPSDVAEGVTSHHGDGVMRYFYNKAVERDGEDNVDINDFRHAGHKPRSKEMAIVMMADSVEGACRAIFQEQEPSAKAITDVVERIVGEKVADGQLSASDLTLGDLTATKAAFVDALIGHYHQRIPYPNFPELGENSGGDAPPDGPEEPHIAPDLTPAENPANE